MTSISPDFSTKNGTLVWPLSINTSPLVIGRITPCEAIRAICAELNTGNRSAAFSELESRVEGGVSVTRNSLWAAHPETHLPAVEGNVGKLLQEFEKLRRVDDGTED